MSTIDPSLGSKVSSRQASWLDLVTRAWGSELHAPDPGIYTFSNGVRKDSTDKWRTGIYGVTVTDSLEFGTPRTWNYLDMDGSITESDYEQGPLHIDLAAGGGSEVSPAPTLGIRWANNVGASIPWTNQAAGLVPWSNA